MFLFSKAVENYVVKEAEPRLFPEFEDTPENEALKLQLLNQDQDQ
jgi:hypothetical protein